MTTRPGSVLRLVLGVAICLLPLARPATAEVLPTDLKIEKVFDVTEQLGDIGLSPRGEAWLLEKTGTLRVFVGGEERASSSLPVTADCGGGLVDVAFAPDYGVSGRAFVYLVDNTNTARVNEIFVRGDALELGNTILELGTTPGGCRAGGGLGFGDDEKLYVAVGDLETSSDAQDDGALPGKVLRAEMDGGIPADNASGTLVWAKGFFDGTDLAVGPTGTVYVADMGFRILGVADEINAVLEGGNCGWDIVTGDSGGAYDDPLVSYLPPVGTEAVELLASDALGEDQQDTLLYVSDSNGEIHQAELTGAAQDQLDSADLFYDSLGDADGTPDPGCPTEFNALAEGNDGWLYAANSGENPGVWRVWQDHPGPREVSAPGSPFEMTLRRTETGLEIGWENLGPLDAGRPVRHGGQSAEAYRIWEGSLANVAAYDHAVILETDGTSTATTRLTAGFTPGDGDRYYLVSAQNDNLEGSVGSASDGTARPVPGRTDYCETRPYGIHVGECGVPWIDYDTGGELKLIDYNPNSKTYLKAVDLNDFRGKVIRMDLSALNCTYCRQQADNAANNELKHGARDFITLTVMTWSYVGVPAIPPSSCAVNIAAWAEDYNVLGPIVCDVDRNGDGHGDVTWQYWVYSPTCGGTPQNFYFDQGLVQYRFRCGGQLSDGAIYADIVGEINPETCE